ncbi:hypothetical protein WAI453_012733 [Rhynchosporium graminicola]
MSRYFSLDITADITIQVIDGCPNSAYAFERRIAYTQSKWNRSEDMKSKPQSSSAKAKPRSERGILLLCRSIVVGDLEPLVIMGSSPCFLLKVACRFRGSQIIVLA